MNSYLIIIVAATSYLLGSIPFGYLLVRFFKGEDVRSSGSGNIGATNVARKSPVLGVTTLLLDAAKGLAAVLLARTLINVNVNDPHRPLIITAAAFFAVLGHLFPIWLKFRGGKGVATSLGAFILLTPKSIVCMIIVFLIVAAATRFISLASVAVAAAFPLLAWGLHEYVDSRQLILIALVALLVIWKHRQNLVRLATGQEAKLRKKLGQKSGTDLGKKSGNELENMSGEKSGSSKSDAFGVTRQ
jgi:glycerol-3-phosphate acyltransferase PlsY